jgi:hypothetical protein
VECGGSDNLNKDHVMTTSWALLACTMGSSL